MRTTFLTVFILAMSFASCERDDSISPDLSQVAGSGSWRVTLFTDSGNDETADFAGYSFTFSSSGTVTADKNGVTQNGTWSLSDNSSTFNIDLGPKSDTNKPLGELTDNWKVLAVNATEIRLTDDNTASNEFLTFTKN